MLVESRVVRMWEEVKTDWKAVSNKYYNEEGNAEECAIEAYRIYNLVIDNNIDLGKEFMFKISSDAGQMLTEANMLESAELVLEDAECYSYNSFSHGMLHWRKAELDYKNSNIDDSEQNFMFSIKKLTEVCNDNKYDGDYKYRRNLIAVKNIYSRLFKDGKMFLEVIVDLVNQFKAGNENLSELRDTYRVFLNTIDDISILSNAKKVLRDNKIVL